MRWVFLVVLVAFGLGALGDEAQQAAQQAAQRLCARLTLEEKITLVHGVDGPYVGQVGGVERLNIPGLTMNDGPQGFRVADDGPVGSSTAWPCALAMAATWDEDLVARWGGAMALEFKQKGAMVLLGPGVNVARVPCNGRNFEYLSGEDPVLGAKLAGAQIRAIQSQGLIANVKHFVHNNQETNRTIVNQIVDERTHWELYMPPFEAAVEAGVLSVMCSYNLVNGRYACENQGTISNDLKQRLGFKGFVVSDWFATHSTVDSAQAGLDMEMPGGEYFNTDLQDAVSQNLVPLETLNDKVERVLYAMIASGALYRPQTGSLDANVTSPEHDELARELAASSVVLLKNENDILPLECRQSIKVIGDVIAAGGGSGHVQGPHVVSGYGGILGKCKGDGNFAVSFAPMEASDDQILGDVDSADVVVIFTSTTSTEGEDRVNLSFPFRDLQVIDMVLARAASKVVIVGTTPGAVLLPFADQIPGLLLAFMPGQEAGNAIADVLFGNVNPAAKLPLTMPNIENEIRFTPHQYPGVNNVANYSEQLLVGYRWYDANKVTPKFPFGFGLSYTQFSYSEIHLTSPREVQFKLTNIGDRNGQEICQLYISFPASAGEPPKLLKHFQKIALNPGTSALVTFSLSERDFSIWDITSHNWVQPQGEFTISIGPSSAELPLSVKMTPNSMVAMR